MKGENLPPGNYEWPFEYALPGNSPVSVEGLEDTWIIYRMKAKIERNVLHQNKVTRKHVRLIKAFDPSTFRFSSPMVSLSNTNTVHHRLTWYSPWSTDGPGSLTTALVYHPKL